MIKSVFSACEKTDNSFLSVCFLGVYHVPATVLSISLITKNISEAGACEFDQTAPGKREYVQHLQGGKAEGQTMWGEWPLCACVYRHVCAQVYKAL